MTIDPILHDTLNFIYEERANAAYGLSLVSQRTHAVQCGAMAMAHGANTFTVVAALTHDIGHMLHGLEALDVVHDVDNHHESIGALWLSRWFGPEVCEPIRLHVNAKRYLCAIEPDYIHKLSGDSVRSLALQGGPMTAQECAEFKNRPFWQEAVALRRWDEAAKDPDGAMPSFASFWPWIEAAFAKQSTLSPAVLQ